MAGIPTIDIAAWRAGDAATRRRIASEVDDALREIGFLLVTGHGVTGGRRAAVRAAARAFFALPEEAKRRYAVSVGGRGWLAVGAEANGYAEGTETPPDLKESLTFGAEHRTGDAAVDDHWFPSNAWPAEVPALRAAVDEYLTLMRDLSDELLRLLADALGTPLDTFTRHTATATCGFNINWYPSRETVGEPSPGQFRIGPHTDFGTVTVLDRQDGKGGLQVWSEADGWRDAPYVPGAFTVNIGDLMARWTGDRWRSGRHQVLPPPADAPAEELMSLVYFYECDHGTSVSPVGAADGWRTTYEPVDSHVYLREKLDAITVG
jgi:isopenicillin N synthase-like dioxygenase